MPQKGMFKTMFFAMLRLLLGLDAVGQQICFGSCLDNLQLTPSGRSQDTHMIHDGMKIATIEVQQSKRRTRLEPDAADHLRKGRRWQRP